ncbi:DNA/RNA helicase, superfamily II [Frankia sp. CcI6]|uniref:DEAD/DEAH box helicase family protein n=1 Tax=Frankia TaxID=1854 RepID=UPI0003D03893|nr:MULTISPECIES: DEAD/DEAH box helicase family protein [Frankia]ETA01209.1 DNA/RNA helicase, superfamily II [Frankia sp. CcI6]KFB04654.1 DNA/RNA helicase, superfamily II [Frankia sp. Allo2]OAA22606.1 ATP-dependent helicase IRC3 [Frankia casuarinae]
MKTSFMDPAFLHEIGPVAFARQVERLLRHLGFTNIVNIDGSNDQGGDLLADRLGERWVFQAKWKARAAVPSSAIDEVVRARAYYQTDRAAVVTNSRFGPSVDRRRDELLRVGVRVDLWSGKELVELYADERVTRPRLPERPLRPYQAEAFQRLVEDLEEHGRALLVLATGLGKTVIGGEVIARHLRRRPADRVLVVAHTKELVEQLERALWHHVGKETRTQLLTGDHKPDDLRGITCATVASALSYVKGGYRPGLVMVDEAHHVAEDGQFAELLDLLRDVQHFGVTATPWRGDRFDIRHRFGEPSYTLGIEDGMRLGYLAEVRYRLFADNIDWDFVREASRHRYTIKDLNARLFVAERDEAIRDQLVDTWARTVEPRAVVFCRTIEHAERMATLLNGVPQWRGAEAVHASLDQRDRQLRLMRFRSGETPIITAVDILNEGVDVPDVNIICFARVTHSRRIFVQQLGRGLRLREGKTHVEALDFVSDIRRVAAIMNLRERVSADEIETLRLSGAGTRFEFMDRAVESLMQEWIKDAASLETALDEARLQFPSPEVFSGTWHE